MGFQMGITKLDGWTSVNIWLTSRGLPDGAGVFVLLLQENSVRSGSSCSQCGTSKMVHQLCVVVIPSPSPPGRIMLGADWLPLCSTCSIALIDAWRSEHR